jgi:thiamine pyrophosphate-dependent acetolactate synthase large subunit-like protein
MPKLLHELKDLAPSMRAKNAARAQTWWKQIQDWKEEHPLVPHHSDTEIKPQHLMAEIDRSPAAAPSSLATSASTRCGPRN